MVEDPTPLPSTAAAADTYAFSDAHKKKCISYRITGPQSVDRLEPLVRSIAMNSILATSPNNDIIDFVWETSCEKSWRDAHNTATVFNKLHNSNIIENKANLAFLQLKMKDVPVIETRVSSDKASIIAWLKHRYTQQQGDTAVDTEWWAVKSSVSNGGRDVWIVNKQTYAEVLLSSEVHDKEEYVVQKYVNNPLLWNGKKFHFRCYTAMFGDMTAYVYQNAFILTAGMNFDFNDTDHKKHVTNLSINKHTKDHPGQVTCHLPTEYPAIYRHIQDCWRSVVTASSSFMEHQRSHAHFDFYGIDIIADTSGNCWLIEANRLPGLESSKINTLEEDSMYNQMMLSLLQIVMKPLFPIAASSSTPTSCTCLWDLVREKSLTTVSSECLWKNTFNWKAFTTTNKAQVLLPHAIVINDSSNATVNDTNGSVTSSSINDKHIRIDRNSNGHRLRICVVGAGLAGAMTAALLAKLGHSIDVYEKREDPRSGTVDENVGPIDVARSALKRSINLALSYRGMQALKAVSPLLLDKVMQIAIRMSCRVIHDMKGNTSKQAYGTSEEDAIWSVSRQHLNSLLIQHIADMEEREAHGSKVRLLFEHSMLRADKDGNVAFVHKANTRTNTINEQYDLVVGSDGAYSCVRDCVIREGVRVSHSRSYIKHGYKELSIPATARGEYALQHVNGLHIWPRDDVLLIALPNLDKSFTVTLFAPYDGMNGFNSICTAEDSEADPAITAYFSKHFPAVLPLIPNLASEFKANPIGSLVTVRMDPWNAGKLLVLGDAAHAVVPFYGQGMNAAFEDALVLYELMSQSNSSSPIQVIDSFSRCRVPAANGLADLCIEHYHDMASNTSSFFYRLRIKVEQLISRMFPNTFVPLYTMVAFTRIPYHDAISTNRTQQRYLSYITTASISLFVGAAITTGFKLRDIILKK